jgi:hypothetical protein
VPRLVGGAKFPGESFAPDDWAALAPVAASDLVRPKIQPRVEVCASHSWPPASAR